MKSENFSNVFFLFGYQSGGFGVFLGQLKKCNKKMVTLKKHFNFVWGKNDVFTDFLCLAGWVSFAGREPILVAFFCR